MAHTPGPWKWWTSCSWRRLTSAAGRGGPDGGVLCPTVMRDGHPDIIVTPDDMGLIAAAPEMLAKLKKIATWLDRLAAQADQQARDSKRFTSLAGACARDAENYRKTAADIRVVITKAETPVPR